MGGRPFFATNTGLRPRPAIRETTDHADVADDTDRKRESSAKAKKGKSGISDGEWH
jgi:hypothetical protein